MQYSDFLLKSVLEVRFNFFTCVSESEFRAHSIWAHYRYPFRIQSALKTLITHARTWHSLQLSKVKFELSSLHQQSKPNLVCRHYYPWITLCVVMHCTVTCDQSWKWIENYLFFKAWKVCLKDCGQDGELANAMRLVILKLTNLWFPPCICSRQPDKKSHSRQEAFRTKMRKY